MSSITKIGVILQNVVYKCGVASHISYICGVFLSNSDHNAFVTPDLHVHVSIINISHISMSCLYCVYSM